MTRFRTLLTVSLLLAGVALVLSDDKKTPPADAKAARKAAREAKLKAEAEAEAKAKAAAEAKAKAEALAKSKGAGSEIDSSALTKRIDEEINKRLASEKVPASPPADDAEFLRRVYLDLTGVVPPAAKVVDFLERKDPQKRSKLIDELLAGPGFGRHMADIWDHLLFQRLSENRAIQRDPLTKWLEERFDRNTPWDALVTELITATGTQEQDGAATFYLSELTADKMVDSISRNFLGIKIECAQCHNHPFTGWKQNDYWGMAAFFMKVRIQGNPKNGKGATPEVNESGRGKQRNLPESAKTLPPKFFQGAEPKVTSNEPLRPVLAKWLTSPDNKFFSRAFVNRAWGQLFGAGIVNPIDDMHDERVPSHPELLAEMSKRFAASGFDVKFLFRAICNSDAYQRSSKPVAGNENDKTLCSHMSIKAFTPEQLYDSLVAVLGDPGAKGGMGKGAAGKGPRQTPRDQFVNFFSPGENTKATDYEEGIPQALRLMNHPFTARTSGPVARELTRGLAKEKAIEKLYLGTLSRRPTPDEVSRLTAYVGKSDSTDAAYGDILWALLNSSEFTLNH